MRKKIKKVAANRRTAFYAMTVQPAYTNFIPPSGAKVVMQKTVHSIARHPSEKIHAKCY